MSNTLALPSPSDPREHLADWVELRALQLGVHSVSVREVIRDLKIGGVKDAFDEWEEGLDEEDDEDLLGEPLVEAAFEEIHERRLSSGLAYPLEITVDNVQLREEYEHGVYAFLALLSRFGKDAGPRGTNAAKLFEDVCAEALKTYLGGDHPNVFTYAFGFPRRTLPSAFCPALDELCQLMGEGIGSRGDQPVSVDQKDAKLDIVAWRDFEDKRQGKLIAFGQCATGADWQGKRSELPRPFDWCAAWMKRVPAIEPIRAFFVPHRIEFEHWENTARFGGLFFDRCRIAYHAVDLNRSAADECARWTRYVLQERLRK